jgi:hypothetical protein
MILLQNISRMGESANKKYAEGKAHAETLRTIAYLGKREYALQ